MMETPHQLPEEPKEVGDEYDSWKEAVYRDNDTILPDYVSTDEFIKLESLVARDTLTGLYSHFEYERNKFRDFERLVKEGGALVVCDIDDLKKVNDSFGHNMGDTYLQKSAGFLSANFPPTDLKYRIGGDEFCMFIFGMQSEHISKRFNEIIQILHDNRQKDKFSPQLSFGVVPIQRNDPTSLEQAVSRADIAMYHAKSRKNDGFSHFLIWEEGMQMPTSSSSCIE